MNENALPTSGVLSTLERAAHQLHEPQRDGQPEPGAAVLARRRSVGLRERLEDQLLLARAGCRCRCRAPGRHDGAPAASVATRRDRDIDRTAPWAVNLMALPTRFSSTWRMRSPSPTGARARRRRPSQVSARPLRLRLHAPARGRVAVGDVARVERQPAEVELAGLDLREVEDVVDHVQQRLGRAADRLDVLRAARRRGRCPSSSSVMPSTPFIGVRISWLMLATNSLLARLACSAASLATQQLVGLRQHAVPQQDHPGADQQHGDADNDQRDGDDAQAPPRWPREHRHRRASGTQHFGTSHARSTSAPAGAR